MLMPKRVKHRKQFRGRMKGRAHRGNTLAYGEFGLQAMEPHWVTSQQIEAARIALTRYTKRGGQVWIKIFPDKPVTAKPAETRMGSGKGAPEYWVAVVKPGRVLFEIAGVSEEIAREALRLASHKLPLKTKLTSSFSKKKMSPRQKRVVKKHEGKRIERHDQGTAGRTGEGTEERAVRPSLPARDRPAAEHHAPG